MTDEAARELAAAMNRLAAAIDGLKGGALTPGINVYHYGNPWQQTQQPHLQPAQWPTYGVAYSGGN